MILSEIQKAVFLRLSAFAGLAGIPIYDHVPQVGNSENPEKFPYITIGEDDHDGWDTDTELGFESIIRVSVWSRHPGREEARGLQDQIYAALHRHDLQVPGLNVIIFDVQSASVQRQDDGKTYHGLQEIRLLGDLT